MEVRLPPSPPPPPHPRVSNLQKHENESQTLIPFLKYLLLPIKLSFEIPRVSKLGFECLDAQSYQTFGSNFVALASKLVELASSSTLQTDISIERISSVTHRTVF